MLGLLRYRPGDLLAVETDVDVVLDDAEVA